MVKHTSLSHLKCWLLGSVDKKIISILAVVGHRVIFLYQVKGQDVIYSLGVIPYRIGISGEVTNFVGVSLLSSLGASMIFERYFS